jgi:tetratricopeptide (TPR) repeat protein
MMCLAVPVNDRELAEFVLRTWDFTDPAGSGERFEAAAAAEPDDVRRQVFLTQVARSQALRKMFAEGHATLDALGVADHLADEPGVRSLLERGRLHNSAGEPATAVPLFEAAFLRAQAAGLVGLAVDAAHMLAIALPPERHEEWARVGLGLADGSDDPLARRMKGALLNNLAWTYADADRWADALPLFEQAVDVRREVGDPEPLLVARWARARALRALGRYDEALAEQRELATLPHGKDDPYVAEEIAANEAALAG